MSFYDHLTSSPNASVTRMGKRLVRYRNKWLLDKISRVASPLRSILEIGPGKGDFAYTCRDRGLAYTGIEINENLAEVLRKDGFTIVTAQVPPLLTTGTFDSIYMNQVFEHMPNANTALELLTSCYNCLSPNGVLLIAAPDYGMWKEDFFTSDYSHEYPVSAERLQQLLSDSRFDVVELGYYSLTMSGKALCAMLTGVVRSTWMIGLFHLFFGRRALKVKTSILPSVYAIAVKRP